MIGFHANFPKRAKRIKNETGLSNGAASVSYAAVHYILKTQKQLSTKNILLLGVGEIGQNTIENLVKHVENPQIKITNRTTEKAEKLAKKYNIPQIDFKKYDKELEQTDILIVATGASRPIIDKENFPKRNRIVAGMCDAVVVVESKRGGGSLITATIANSYNKDIFACCNCAEW